MYKRPGRLEDVGAASPGDGDAERLQAAIGVAVAAADGGHLLATVTPADVVVRLAQPLDERRGGARGQQRVRHAQADDDVRLLVGHPPLGDARPASPPREARRIVVARAAAAPLRPATT